MPFLYSSLRSILENTACIREKKKKNTGQNQIHSSVRVYMAARGGDGGDRREMTQEDHLAPWFLGNKNQGVVSQGSSLLQEGRFIKQGFFSQASKVYELQAVHISDNPKITKLNHDILDKVNSLEVQRVEYQTVVGSSCVGELNVTIKNIRNLKAKIERLQICVEELGGTYFRTPKELYDAVKDI